MAGPVGVPLIVLGWGGVGRSLVRQLLDCRQLHAHGYNLHFQLRGAADSSGYLQLPPGQSDAVIETLIDWKDQGRKFVSHPDFSEMKLTDELSGWTDQPGLIADCTAADTASDLRRASDLGWGIALANKRPLAGSLTQFRELTPRGSVSPLIRWEATVGAGLPVTTTLRRLAAAGDQVQSMVGAVSSTLGHIMSGLERGEPLSRLVAEVKRQGYTEPDPREDLSGRDVGRKALILARTLGWPLEPEEIRVEGLLPRLYEALPLDVFWTRLSDLDDSWRERASRAASRGKVLRYCFRLDAAGATVGPLSVPAVSPMGRLRGTNQVVQISSHCYSDVPLLIQGRGVGVAATAAGVLADLVEIAPHVGGT